MQALSNQLMENKALMFAAAAIAFFVAAVLILLVFRLTFGRRLHMPGGRSRQMRLGIVDAFDLDRQRQLVLVRRDNVEHLIMIGGPNDILIESQIVRSEARETRGRDKEVREKEQSFVPAPSVKPAATEPKLPIPPLASEPQPIAAAEPLAPAATTVPPSMAPISPSSRPPIGAPPLRRSLSPITGPLQKPLPTHEPASAETDRAATPQAPKPPVRPPQSTQAGEPLAFMRWPARTPTTPAAQSKQTAPTPPIPDAEPSPAPEPSTPPEPPVAGPPIPSLEGLESLEEEMAKLLGRGPTKP